MEDVFHFFLTVEDKYLLVGLAFANLFEEERCFESAFHVNFVLYTCGMGASSYQGKNKKDVGPMCLVCASAEGSQISS